MKKFGEIKWNFKKNLMKFCRNFEKIWDKFDEIEIWQINEENIMKCWERMK